MEPNLLQIDATDAELEELRMIESTFALAETWGYDQSGHSRFEKRAHDFPLGIETQEYTDVVFRNFRRAGTGEPLFFASDIATKFERQSALSEMTKAALTDLVNEYFDGHPKPGTRTRLAVFASDIRIDSVSAVHYGIRQGVAQLLAIANGSWGIVSGRRTDALEAFASMRRSPEVLREEGSGEFDGWDFWITSGPDGAGSSHYPTGSPELATVTGNYNEDETLINDDDDWEKIWKSWSKGSPEKTDLAPFAAYVAGLEHADIERVLQ